jgi:hypothetical protein
MLFIEAPEVIGTTYGNPRGLDEASFDPVVADA